MKAVPPLRPWPVLIGGLAAGVLVFTAYFAISDGLPWIVVGVLAATGAVIARLFAVVLDQLLPVTFELTAGGLRIGGWLTARTYSWLEVIEVVVEPCRGRFSDPSSRRAADVGLFVVVEGLAPGRARREQICIVCLPAEERPSLERVARRIVNYQRRVLSVLVDGGTGGVAALVPAR